MDDRKQALLERFKRYGITYVVAEYSGSGDSGQVDDIQIEINGESKPLRDFTEPDDDKIVAAVTAKLEGREHKNSFYDEVEEFVYDALEFVGAEDWWNNDGGDGTLHIYVEADEHNGEPVEAGTVKIDHGWNVTERNTSEYEL